MESVLKGRFMSDFESYTLDQFPFRNAFRGIKTAFAQNLFGQEDVNDLYVEDGYIVSMEYPENTSSLDWAAGRFQNIYDMYLNDYGGKIYFSIIPDKNYFFAEDSGHLSIDYASFIESMVRKVPYMNYIDITEKLSKESYYKTDSHWKQTALMDVADVLLNGMDMNSDMMYETVTVETPFYGVYHGQLALPIDGDILEYLTNATIEDCEVYDHQNGKEMQVYDLEKVNGKDPYEMFLGGPLSLVTIKNPNATSDRKLVIFRDSFSSSLAPLLIAEYEEVVLVDIRYIQPALLGEYITFEDQDVLFIYSTSVLNNSNTIK